MALGVSYVNELNHAKALSTLQLWVQHHPKFRGITVDSDVYSDGSLLDDVMQLMSKAARWDSADPQVHVVMGVLYNVSRDYASAVGAFRKALEAMPEDYSLWNKVCVSVCASVSVRLFVCLCVCLCLCLCLCVCVCVSVSVSVSVFVVACRVVSC